MRGNRTVNFQFSAPECESRVNHSDITCWIYCAHISSGMYGGLNPSKLSCHYSLVDRYLLHIFFCFFFVLHIKSHATYIHDLILYELMENYILIYNFFKKNIVSFSMLLNCRVILPHPPHNIVICTIPLEF